MAYHFDFIKTGRVIKEFALYPDPVRCNTPDGKCFVDAAALNGNDDALKNLNPLTVAFHNPNVNVNGIPRRHFRSTIGEFFYRSN